MKITMAMVLKMKTFFYYNDDYDKNDGNYNNDNVKQQKWHQQWPQNIKKAWI